MKLISVLFAGALLWSGPVQAATYIITYQGTVRNSVDYTGFFGGSGSSLDGLNFTAIYTLTTPLNGALISGDGVTYSYFSGGGQYGILHPSPVSATLEINDIVHIISGNFQGLAGQFNEFGESPGFDEITHSAIGRRDFSSINGFSDDVVQLRIGSYVNDIVQSVNHTSTLTYNTQMGDYPNGSFIFGNYLGFDGYGHADVRGSLLPTSVTIALAPVAGGVPEPATWALMILGFGMAGVGMRARRRRLRVDYA